MNQKKVLFLYPIQPQPLPVHMLNLLSNIGKYEVSLLYFNRINSPVTVPLSGLLDDVQHSAVTWHAGNHLFSQIVNRCMVSVLFVKRIRAHKPDIIHAWNLEMLVYARLAALSLKHTRIVFSLQDTTNWMLSPVVKALQRWIYRRVDLFFVTSQGFESEFLRRFHLIKAQQKVIYVPNVPPVAQFARFEPRKRRVELTVGYIGTLRGEEGIRTLVEAVSSARTRDINVRVLFAGTGKELELVKRLSEKGPFVDYLGPYSHDKQIFNLYGRVDLLYAIYDRSYDKKIHLAYRLCEAVNCRLPIIVAKGTHMAEVVERYGIGVSVETGDAEGLARELQALCCSPEERSRIALNCEKALPEFVFEYYQERICRAYEAL